MPVYNGLLIEFKPLEASAAVTLDLTAPAWSASTAIASSDVIGEQILTAPSVSPTTQVLSPTLRQVLLAPLISSTIGIPLGHIYDAGTIFFPLWSDTTTVPGGVVAGPLIAPLWVPTAAVQSGTVAGPLIAPAWAPTTAVQSGILAGPLVAPVWSSSTTVGIHKIGAFFFPALIASTVSIGLPTIALAQIVNPGVWSPSTQIALARAGVTISAPFIDSAVNIFNPELVGPLLAPTVNSTINIFAPQIRRVIEFATNIATGTTRGGDELILFGSGLDMSNCTPTYVNGTLNAGFWTDLSTNSGSVVENATAEAFQLSTGFTPNSVAGIRSTGVAGNLDIEILASSLTADSIIQSAAELALYVSAGTDFRLTALNGRIKLTVRENGMTNFDQVIATTGGRPQLRLLRVDNIVYVILGGKLITQASWVSTNCQIEIQTRNNTLRASQSVLRVSQYTRRPVVVFGDNPITDMIVINQDQAVATTPAKKIPGVVDIKLTGCSTTTDTLSSAFTYFLDPELPRVFNIPLGPRMTAISDSAVTGRING